MLCKGSLPRNTRFFSLAAQMRMRYQAVDHDGVTIDARKERLLMGRATQCCFQMYNYNISDVNIE
jgi:hypothetical protein